jgi:hypothetical protein
MGLFVTANDFFWPPMARRPMCPSIMMNALLNAGITVKKRQKNYWCMALSKLLLFVM